MLIQFLYTVPLPENSYTYPNKPYIMALIDLYREKDVSTE